MRNGKRKRRLHREESWRGGRLRFPLVLRERQNRRAVYFLHVPQQAFLASVVAAGFTHLQAPFLHPQGILHSHFPAGHLQAGLTVHFPSFLQTFLQVHFPAGHLQGALMAHLPAVLQAPAFGQPCFRLH